MHRIDVLNAGYVRLLSYMQPVPNNVEIVGPSGVSSIVRVIPREWTGDLEIARDANHQPDRSWRESGHMEHEKMCLSLLPPMSNGETRPCNCTPVERTDRQLLRTMMKRAHTTPFEAMVFRFEVKAPIFVLRQWHRHRTWTYDEKSARYEEMEEEYYVPLQEHIGVQDPKNRQSRSFANSVADEYAERDRQRRITESFGVEASHAHERYRMRIEEKVPREIARINLPLSTYSTMSATVDLHNLMHFLRLRMHHHAQYEIQVYARALLDLVAPIVPVTIAEFVNTLPFDEYGIRYQYAADDRLTRKVENKALDAPRDEA